MKKKLIEVALPLETINEESARKKAIRRAHCTAGNPHPASFISFFHAATTGTDGSNAGNVREQEAAQC
jgi:hypothetical protein